MVDWFAGKRVRGTSSERSGFGTSLGGTGVGGWVELGRTTLGSANATISVTGLSDKRYYMVLADMKNTTTSNNYYQLNTDTGSNYSSRRSDNGGVEDTNTSWAYLTYLGGSGSATNQFNVGYLANYSTKEKLYLGHTASESTAGAGTAPQRNELTGKHAQTSNPISSIQLKNLSNTLATGSEVVVLGYDPADTHTNNFWEELYSGSGDAGMDTGVSGFSARKYLWIQMYLNDMISGANVNMVLNGVESSNYALRYNQNDGTDGTITSRSDNLIHLGASNETEAFINIFIINNGSNEKLGIVHNMTQQTAGATTAPARSELVFKDSQTTQITDVEVRRTSGSWGANSELRIWGAD